MKGLVRRWGRKLVVSPALNTYGSSGNLDFNVEPDTYLDKPQAMGWAFKKTDFLQADGQEGADLVYFGKRSGKPTYAVYPTSVD
jgi:hypothetical protein